MNAVRRACMLLLGTMLLAGCTERIAPTAISDKPVAFLADLAGANASVDDVENGYNHVVIFDVAPDVGVASWPQ